MAEARAAVTPATATRRSTRTSARAELEGEQMMESWHHSVGHYVAYFYPLLPNAAKTPTADQGTASKRSSG